MLDNFEFFKFFLVYLLDNFDNLCHYFSLKILSKIIYKKIKLEVKNFNQNQNFKSRGSTMP
ncbi:hypothetical protein BBW65_00770 [Helicobacter enhydrae]|uniref:Uncharacterized protein n=1 Tax=Helicobacter enhydrae TaxID=222136 RepID=A0A1B1U3S2_9HELI|nr:hypothetical protein BBW65_00770 [Helicobacter enhydrae]